MSRRQPTSRSGNTTIAPEMLEVQTQLRDAVFEISECLSTNLPRIARMFEAIAKKYCDK